MKRYTLLSILFAIHLMLACKGQKSGNTENNPDLEKTDAHLIRIPNQLMAADTSPAWNLKKEKLLIAGTVYQPDGITPAPGVLIYYYHTNPEGRYIHKENEKRSMPPNKKGQTHGYIRGWVKSDSLGKYFIYTIRPGAYPADETPAHIHLTLKDPAYPKAYYIDDIVFDDDKLLKSAIRQQMENRGGNGVVRLVKKGDLHIGERNIITGLNIPVYPTPDSLKINSGKSIGEPVFSFTPYHTWGPDKGTKTCPVCKYGWYHGVLYFAGKNSDWEEIKTWLGFLEKESSIRQKYLKVYFVYDKSENTLTSTLNNKLERIGNELQLKHIALTYLPSFDDKETDACLNNINGNRQNTFILYKRGIIIGRYIDLKPVTENFQQIKRRLDETINEYFAIPA